MLLGMNLRLCQNRIQPLYLTDEAPVESIISTATGKCPWSVSLCIPQVDETDET